MRAQVITINNHPASETGFNNLVKSSKAVGNKFIIDKFSAITPDQVDDLMKDLKLEWNWPWEGEVDDTHESGLIKRAYQTANPKARIACFLSHYMLWLQIFNYQEPTIIFEHDAVFTEHLDTESLSEQPYEILGLNNPLGATRRARLFYEIVQSNPDEYQNVPIIDYPVIPQGIAGNSAYYMTPAGAEIMLKLTDKYGMWPNDGLMCYQLAGADKLGVTKTFYTTVQGLESTTTR